MFAVVCTAAARVCGLLLLSVQAVGVHQIGIRLSQLLLLSNRTKSIIIIKGAGGRGWLAEIFANICKYFCEQNTHHAAKAALWTS